MVLQHDLDDVKKIEKELEKYDRPFLKVSEVAKLLGVSRRLVHYYCQRGEIFAIKLSPRKEKKGKGGSWLIYKESLIEFLLRRNNYEVF
jgi:predicted DNA-binding transcriptional regulator AlpA